MRGCQGFGIARPRLSLTPASAVALLLVACQPGRRRTYDAVALLEFSNRRLPSVLTPEEAAVADRPEALADGLATSGHARLGPAR